MKSKESLTIFLSLVIVIFFSCSTAEAIQIQLTKNKISSAISSSKDNDYDTNNSSLNQFNVNKIEKLLKAFDKVDYDDVNSNLNKNESSLSSNNNELNNFNNANNSNLSLISKSFNEKIVNYELYDTVSSLCTNRCLECNYDKCLKCKDKNLFKYYNDCVSSCPDGFILNVKEFKCVEKMKFENYKSEIILNQRNFIKENSFNQCANSCNKMFSDCSCKEDCLLNGTCCSDYASFCLKIELKIKSPLEIVIKESLSYLEDKCEIRLGRKCLQCKEPYYYLNGDCVRECPKSRDSVFEKFSTMESYVSNHTNRLCLKRKNCLIYNTNSSTGKLELNKEFKLDGELYNCQVCDTQTKVLEYSLDNTIDNANKRSQVDNVFIENGNKLKVNNKCTKCLRGFYLHKYYEEENSFNELSECLEICPFGYVADTKKFECVKFDNSNLSKQLDLVKTNEINSSKLLNSPMYFNNSFNSCQGNCGKKSKDSYPECSCETSCVRKGNCCQDFKEFCFADYRSNFCSLCDDCLGSDLFYCARCKENSYFSSGKCLCKQGYKYNKFMDNCEKTFTSYLVSNQVNENNEILSVNNKNANDKYKVKNNDNKVENISNYNEEEGIHDFLKLLTNNPKSEDVISFPSELYLNSTKLFDNNNGNAIKGKTTSKDNIEHLITNVTNYHDEIVKNELNKAVINSNSNLLGLLSKNINKNNNNDNIVDRNFLQSILQQKFQELMRSNKPSLNSTNVLNDILSKSGISPMSFVINGNVSINLLTGNEKPKIITQNIYNTDSYNSNQSTTNNKNSNNNVDIKKSSQRDFNKTNKNDSKLTNNINLIETGNLRKSAFNKQRTNTEQNTKSKDAYKDKTNLQTGKNENINSNNDNNNNNKADIKIVKPISKPNRLNTLTNLKDDSSKDNNNNNNTSSDNNLLIAHPEDNLEEHLLNEQKSQITNENKSKSKVEELKSKKSIDLEEDGIFELNESRRSAHSIYNKINAKNKEEKEILSSIKSALDSLNKKTSNLNNTIPNNTTTHNTHDSSVKIINSTNSSVYIIPLPYHSNLNSTNYFDQMHNSTMNKLCELCKSAEKINNTEVLSNNTEIETVNSTSLTNQTQTDNSEVQLQVNGTDESVKKELTKF